VDLYIHSLVLLNGVLLNQLSTGATLPYLYLVYDQFCFHFTSYNFCSDSITLVSDIKGGTQTEGT
jgi:hypothetical protein